MKSTGRGGLPDRLHVTEAGRSELPPWLHFTDATGLLSGVALKADLGTHFVNVTTLVPRPGDTLPKTDIFLLAVVEPKLHRHTCDNFHVSLVLDLRAAAATGTWRSQLTAHLAVVARKPVRSIRIVDIRQGPRIAAPTEASSSS